MNKTLVTGASGFIGHHLVNCLLEEGHEVIATTRYDNVVKNQRLREIWNDITVVEMDIRNRGRVEKEISKLRPDVIFHLAAYNHVGQSWNQVEECFDVNAKGSANIIDTACEHDAKLIYISSSEVYGLQKETPWIESMRPNPQSPYAVTKYAGELYAQVKQRQGHNIAIARPFNVYGPGQSSKAVIGEFIIKALKGQDIVMTSGSQTREFNYVSDTIDALMVMMEVEIDGPVNIANGCDISINNLAELIIQICKSESKIVRILPSRPNEIQKMCASSERAGRHLGWKPKTSLEDGLAATIDWYTSHEEMS